MNILAAIICVVGLIIYIVASNPKLAELGRIMFGVGLLVVLATTGSKIL